VVGRKLTVDPNEGACLVAVRKLAEFPGLTDYQGLGEETVLERLRSLRSDERVKDLASVLAPPSKVCCIGTPIVTGDAFGPMVWHILHVAQLQAVADGAADPLGGAPLARIWPLDRASAKIDAMRGALVVDAMRGGPIVMRWIDMGTLRRIDGRRLRVAMVLSGAADVLLRPWTLLRHRVWTTSRSTWFIRYPDQALFLSGTFGLDREGVAANAWIAAAAITLAAERGGPDHAGDR
jgi:hypothetical protein